MNLIRYFLFCLFVFFTTGIYCQVAAPFKNRLFNVLNEVPKSLPDQEACRSLIDDLEDLGKDADATLENEDVEIEPEERSEIRGIKAAAEAVISFLRCVGNAGYAGNYMKEKELQTVRSLLDFSIAQVYTGKFCAALFEVKVDKYICLLALKNGGNTIWTIKSLTKWTNGNSKMEMGLMPNEYRKMWSNADKPNVQSYQVVSVECIDSGTPANF